jgi:hypothetical protein
MFSTPLEAETRFDYPKNTIMFIKKNQEYVALTSYQLQKKLIAKVIRLIKVSTLTKLNNLP